MTSILKADTIQDTDGNNIINENSNTITIGASGDTISIPSGATIANSGTATGFGEENKPIFKVSGGNTSTSHNTWTKLGISTETIDTGSCFDLGSNNRFTPNKAGKYLVTLTITIPSSTDTDYFSGDIYKNGSSHTGANAINRDYNSVSFSSIVEANGSSDYFEAYGEQESGGSLNMRVDEFSGFYIGN